MNFIDAAASGAANAIVLVANIAANLIAFIAILHFINATLTWFGRRAGVEELTYEVNATCRISVLHISSYHQRFEQEENCYSQSRLSCVLQQQANNRLTVTNQYTCSKAKPQIQDLSPNILHCVLYYTT